eukprot:Gb_24101 [translate_table: standard]
MAALISCLASCSAVKLDNCVADASQFWGPNRTFSTRRATMAGLPPVSCFMNGQKPVVDKAIIVGGGLGGLSAAIQLRKIGIDAHFVPWRMELRFQCAQLDLFNALIRQWDVHDPHVFSCI